MAEIEEINLLLNVVVGLVIVLIITLGGSLFWLLYRPALLRTYPVLVPIKGAILSLMGVFAFALALGAINYLLRLVF